MASRRFLHCVRAASVAVLSWLLVAVPTVAQALPDLSPEIFDASEVVQDVPLAEVLEGCAKGTDDRRLIRFALRTRNLGPDPWNLGDPGCPDCAANPGAACTNPLFVCGTGHPRVLVQSFARPELVDAGGAVVAQGYKPGFCLVDSICAAPVFSNCNPMGISPGCADLYISSFPCMYVDFTDENLPAGTYTLRVTSDPADRLAEADETNNVAEIQVEIGPPPDACGDGNLDVGETCDDGGTVGGDGCDAECQVETCSVCAGEPSSCVTDVACLTCRRVIGKESAKLAQARSAILTTCELAKVKGRHDEVCPDPAGTDDGRRAAEKLARALARYHAKIGRSCGGVDRVCGGSPAGEVSPASLRFPGTCPGMKGGGDPACTAAVDDCGDVATCLECLQRTAVDRNLALLFTSLKATDPRAERSLNRCQRTIGNDTQRLLASNVAERARCWDARRKGRHADDCPDGAAPFDSAAFRAAAKIARAVSRHEQRLCRACGGGDRACTYADDLDPQTQIGFPVTCYDVTIPGGAVCSRTIATVQDLVDCAACVAAYHATCIEAATVPEYLDYPPECQPYGP